jgi:hypothetical protein
MPSMYEIQNAYNFVRLLDRLAKLAGIDPVNWLLSSCLQIIHGFTKALIYKELIKDLDRFRKFLHDENSRNIGELRGYLSC